ncbi:MAG: glycerol-3-phosphate 1-O-acyltransferase PlsY [candidate division WOR-3 bacterium]
MSLNSILTTYLTFGIISYLMGAIPFGFLISKLKGVDIRNVGSKNIGATNVFRSVGPIWGIITFILDFLKGFTPSFCLPLIAQYYYSDIENIHMEILPIYCMALAIIGHNWPVFLHFKGGKGVATGIGGLIAIAPLSALVATAIWTIVFLTWRYVSLASISAATATAIFSWVMFAYKKSELLTSLVLTILCFVVIIKHHANIQRLIKGTELRFGNKN